MNSPDRLAPLRRRAALLEEHAAQTLAAALARNAQAEARHAELCRYETEYAERALPGHTAVLALRQQSAFLARLREAVAFQAERLRRSAENVEQARARWLDAHREVEKLDLLAAQLARQLQLRDQRRQSRDMDEAASRAHRIAACGLIGAP